MLMIALGILPCLVLLGLVALRGGYPRSLEVVDSSRRQIRAQELATLQALLQEADDVVIEYSDVVS